MKTMYELLSESNPNNRNIVATIVEGEYTGDKIFLSNGEVLYHSGEELVDRDFQNTLSDMQTSATLQIKGQRTFCEILSTEKKLVICGAGHVSMPIIGIGRMLGFHVTVIEDRPIFADHARKQGADRVLCEPFEKGLDQIPGDKDTYFVIVTRGHRYDQICLSKIAEKQHAYIGMMGSKLRVKTVLGALLEEGVSQDVLSKVYTPIGLGIQAETPEEIAVAIVAEIIQVKNQNGRSCGYDKKILKTILEKKEMKTAAVLATIIAKKGSAPRDIGTKMLISADGMTEGTIGGGCMEAEVCQRALLMTREEDAKSKVCRVDMTGQQAEDEGMVCGGIIEVLLERVS